MPGVAVHFQVVTGGDALTAADPITDGQGRVSSTLTLGTAPGSAVVTATAGSLAGSPVTFHARGIEKPAPGPDESRQSNEHARNCRLAAADGQRSERRSADLQRHRPTCLAQPEQRYQARRRHVVGHGGRISGHRHRVQRNTVEQSSLQLDGDGTADAFCRFGGCDHVSSVGRGSRCHGHLYRDRVQPRHGAGVRRHHDRRAASRTRIRQRIGRLHEEWRHSLVPRWSPWRAPDRP